MRRQSDGREAAKMLSLCMQEKKRKIRTSNSIRQRRVEKNDVKNFMEEKSQQDWSEYDGNWEEKTPKQTKKENTKYMMGTREKSFSVHWIWCDTIEKHPKLLVTIRIGCRCGNSAATKAYHLAGNENISNTNMTEWTIATEQYRRRL